MSSLFSKSLMRSSRSVFVFFIAASLAFMSYMLDPCGGVLLKLTLPGENLGRALGEFLMYPTLTGESRRKGEMLPGESFGLAGERAVLDCGSV